MVEILSVFLRWKWPILIVTAVAGILAVIFSLLQPNYYKSTTVFLAANPYMIDRQNLFSKTPGENPVFMFGVSADIDRLIAIGKSQPLVSYIINKYDLLKHYEVKESDPLRDYKVDKKFNGNYKIFKNALDAIEVHVEDQDPEKAAQMANDIVAKIDSINVGILSNSKLEMSNILDRTIVEMQSKVQRLTDSIGSLRRQNKVRDVEILEEVRENAIVELSETQTVKDQYRSLTSDNVTSIYMLQKAYPSVKKSKPTRSIIVLSTALLALLAAIGVALIFEQLKSGKFDRKDG